MATKRVKTIIITKVTQEKPLYRDLRSGKKREKKKKLQTTKQEGGDQKRCLLLNSATEVITV